LRPFQNSLKSLYLTYEKEFGRLKIQRGFNGENWAGRKPRNCVRQLTKFQDKNIFSTFGCDNMILFVYNTTYSLVARLGGHLPFFSSMNMKIFLENVMKII
jgi:hypothetical protein